MARSTIVYGAAVAASGIAVATAVEAWVRLQHPDGAGSLFSSLASEAFLAIALPLLAVGLVVGLCWGTRSLVGGRSKPRPAAAPSPLRAAAGSSAAGLPGGE